MRWQWCGEYITDSTVTGFMQKQLSTHAEGLRVLTGPAIISMLLLVMLSFQLAHAQQFTDTLKTSTFRLVINRYTIGGEGYSTGIRECRYLPTGRVFQMDERETIIAWVDTLPWAYPYSYTVHPISDSVIEFTVPFRHRSDPQIIGSIRMRIISHGRFLEFELLDVIGDCRSIWLFAPLFHGIPQGSQPSTKGDYEQITYLGNGYYAGLIGANANTGTFRNCGNCPTDTTVLLQAISPRWLPTPPGVPHRTQRFAFFLCTEQELKDIIREVEGFFAYPYGVSLKENVENNIDYLFLMDESLDVSAQSIIQLCRETNLGAVLLFQGFWSDWHSQSEPFKLWPGIKQFIDSLKAAGLIVGIHTYVHLVPKDGYYAYWYRDSVSLSVIEGTFRSLKWTNNLTDSVALHFAGKADTLGVEWLYFDGNSMLIEINGQHVEDFDPYLDARMTTKIMQHLRQRNHDLKIFQSAGGTLGYPYLSRAGQTDYWDVHPNTGRTPIQEMNFIASQAPYRRRAFLYSDLGWFGREIHCNSCTGGRRDARWDEWQHLCSTSLAYNIPIGIRTTYNDFMTDSLRNWIIPLLRETIRQRRGLTSIKDKEHLVLHFTLEQNYPNPFNPSTTIHFSIPQRGHVTLKVFDVLGSEVARLVDEELNPGEHSVVFNAKNLPSGVYLYRLQTGSYVQQKKMVVVK